MFTILQRYISKTILVSTALVALIIISVIFVITLLGELKDIGQGDYGLTQALFYVLFRLPNDIYQFSPMLLLIGSIVGLSILSSHRELAVMRASGFAIGEIIKTTICMAFLMVLVITLLGEWVAPHWNHKAEMHKENAQHAGQAVITAAGVWLHVDDNFIHVRQVVGKDLLEGVTRNEFDQQHRLKVVYYAKTMVLKDKQWTMNDVVKTQFFNDRTKSQSFVQLPWDLKFNASLLNVGKMDPNEMTLPALITFARYLDKNGLQSSEYKYNFWQRIFQPFASMIMIFLALPFVLGAMSASTLGWRIIIGILAGFAFFILNAFLGQLCVVYQIPTMLAALLPLILFVVVGVIFTKQLIRQ